MCVCVCARVCVHLVLCMCVYSQTHLSILCDKGVWILTSVYAGINQHTACLYSMLLVVIGTVSLHFACT